MDLQQFQEILQCTLENDYDTRKQAEDALEELKESDYSLFLNLALESIDNPMNEKISPISIIQIFREAKSGQLFQDENCLISFLNSFSANVTSELLSPNIQSNFKMMISSILAIIHIYIFDVSENSTISEYILTTYEDTPDIRPYLMNSICEVALSDPNLGGFDFDNIITILFDDLSDQTLFIPRIHLYFALAKNKPDLEVFHNNFDSIVIDPILNSEYSLDVIKSIANFSDTNGYFFADHAITLFDKLRQIALDKEIKYDLRNLSILCIVSIVRNASEMCKSLEGFYQEVVAPLVLVVSEITEEDRWEYDPNDNTPCQSALEAIEMIDEIVENQDGFDIIFQMYQPILTAEGQAESDPNLIENINNGPDSWEAKYALISSLAVTINPAFISKPNSEDSVFPILELIVPLIRDTQTHPRIRAAIYQFIRKTFTFIQSGFQMADTIEVIINAALEEEELIVKQNAFKTLVSYFQSRIHLNYDPNFYYDKYFEPYFSGLLEEIQNNPPEINKYIIRCIGYLAKITKGNYKNYFEETTQIFYDLLTQSDSSLIKINVIYSFAYSLYYIKLTDNHEILEILYSFLQEALSIYGSDEIDEEDSDDLINSISFLLLKLKDEAAPLIGDFCPHVLEVAMKNIEIEQAQIFEGVYGLSSIYIQIPSKDNSVKLYVARNDAYDVKNALLLLHSILVSMSDCDEQFVEQCIEVAKHWITSDYFINIIAVYSWKILFKILDLNQQDISFVEFYLQLFIDSIDQTDSIVYMAETYDKVVRALKYALALNWDNEKMFSDLLLGLPKIINVAIQYKLNTYNVMHNTDYFDRKISKMFTIDDLLSIINKLIKRCFQISLQMTYECLEPEIIPQIEKFTQDGNIDLLIFSSEFIMNLYLFSKTSIDKIFEFINFLIGSCLYLTQNLENVDLIERLMEIFGKFLFQINLDENTQSGVNITDYLVNFFYDYIMNVIENKKEGEEEDFNENKYDNLNDCANIAFSKLLLTNLNNSSDPADAAYKWTECKPLWNWLKDSHYYYRFMVELLDQKEILESFDEDFYWVEQFLPQILSDKNFDKYGRDNLARLAVHLKEELLTERGNQCVEYIIESKVSTLSSSEDEEEEQNNEVRRIKLLQEYRCVLNDILRLAKT